MGPIDIIESDKGVVTIRTAGPADTERLRELRLEALGNAPQAFSSDQATAALEPLASWVERLERYQQGINETMSVAAAEEQLVGMAGIFRDPRPKIRHAATIYGVYVNPEWRGMHIAEKLVRANLAWAASHEVMFVRLGVITVNASAIQCYLRCGFSVYGVEPMSICYEERYYDELMMGVQIEPGCEIGDNK